MTSPDLTAPGLTEVTIRVNGTNRTLAVDPRMSLLDLLRERF